MTSTLPSVPSVASLGSHAVLLHVKTASWLRGKNEREMRELCDGGSLWESGFQWVFDLSVDFGKSRRELRFFAGEILAPERTKAMKLATVLAGILPVTVSSFPNGRLVKDWQVTHAHIYALKAARALPEGPSTARAALVNFLTRRLLK